MLEEEAAPAKVAVLAGQGERRVGAVHVEAGVADELLPHRRPMHLGDGGEEDLGDLHPSVVARLGVGLRQLPRGEALLAARVSLGCDEYIAPEGVVEGGPSDGVHL